VRARSSIVLRRLFLLAAPLAIALSLVAPQPANAASCNSRGACVLVFTVQPADTTPNQTISNSTFSGSGAAVTVQLQYASTHLPATGNADTIVVQLVNAATNTAVGSFTSGSTTSGTLNSSTANVSFSNLAVDTHGVYALRAVDTSNSRVGSGTSGAFHIWDSILDCTQSSGTACQAGLAISGDNETGTVQSGSNSGTLAAVLGDFDKATFLQGCGAKPKDQFGPNVGDVETLNGNGTKTVTVIYLQPYVVLQASNGASAYQICIQFDNGASFQDRNNHTVTQGIIPGPCGSTATPFSKANPVQAPCWTQKTKNTNNSTVDGVPSGSVKVVFVLPADDRFCC
jgi:hypothetical protein